MEKTRLSKDERKALHQKIIDALVAEPLFAEFKYSKSYDGIVKKTKFGHQRVDMYIQWDGYDLQKKELAVTIMNIGYGVRFDVLHKWFEKYSTKILAYQRTADSIGRTASMLGFKDYPRSYDFVYSGEDFEENLAEMVRDIVKVATYFFDKYRSLEDLYEALVVPVLEGKEELPGVGADWIFQYLTLTKLVDNKNYDKLKELILGRTGWMNAEPNIIKYKEKLNEIFEYLEALELEMPPKFPQL